MIVTSDILRLTAAGLKTVFDAEYAKRNAGAAWSQIATNLETGTPIQDYGWLGGGVSMEKLVDEPREQEINSFAYTLQDELYKGRLVIKRTTLEDDQTGLLKLRVEDLAGTSVRHWDKLAFGALPLGFVKKCYDGQYFFDSDHKDTDNGPEQSNVTSDPLSDAALEAAERKMLLTVDDKGEPMDVKPNILVVGPANKRKAMDLVGSDVVVINVGQGVAGGGATAATPYSNYQKGRYTVICDARIRDNAAYNWFLLDCTRAIKPIVIQSRSDVPMTVETDLLDPAARMNEKFHFDVRERKVQGYGLWQLAYGSNATA